MSDARDEPRVSAPDSQPFPPGNPSGSSQAGRERSVSPVVVAAIVGVLALLVGGVGGYLIGAGVSGHDVSVEGQVSYACALVEKVRDDHKSAEDWGDPYEDKAYSDTAAIATLLGGFVSPSSTETETFPELGARILHSLSRVDHDEMNSALEKTHTKCENR